MNQKEVFKKKIKEAKSIRKANPKLSWKMAIKKAFKK